MEPFGLFAGIGFMVAIIYLSKGFAHRLSGGKVAALRVSARASKRSRKRHKHIDTDLSERQLDLES